MGGLYSGKLNVRGGNQKKGHAFQGVAFPEACPPILGGARGGARLLKACLLTYGNQAGPPAVVGEAGLSTPRQGKRRRAGGEATSERVNIPLKELRGEILTGLTRPTLRSWLRSCIRLHRHTPSIPPQRS